MLAYARVSGAEQGQHGTSLDSQREAFGRWCREVGAPEPQVFVEVESGGDGARERRTEQARLMAELREGDVVLVARQDRWSRSTLHLLESVGQIERAGARFYSISERFDPSTPDGRFATTIMAAVAEQEHARIRDRTVGARKRLRALGQWTEGAVPLGYRIDTSTGGRRLVVDEGDAEIVRATFALSVAGLSSREIGAEIARRWPGVRGLDHASIARRLRSRVYLGESHTYGAQAQHAARGTWIATHPPLVDAATFRAAGAALDRRRLGGGHASASSRSASFAARGLVRCGGCGHVATAHGAPRSHVAHGGWYACQWRGERGELCPARCHVRFAAADAELSARALDRLRELVRELAAPAPAPAPPLGAPDHGAIIARIVARRDRLVARVADGTLSATEARATLDRIERELAAATDARDRDAAPPPAPGARAAQLRDVRAMSRAWAALGPAERRTALASLAERITLHGSTSRGWRVEIVWRAAPGR